MALSKVNVESGVSIVRVDYLNEVHTQHLLLMLDAYASDPMGGGEALSAYAHKHLVSELQKVPNAVSFLAYLDGSPVGIINGFEAFSTFAAKRLINIHDLAVLPAARGRGVARQLLLAMERHALSRGCCKLTLEVLTGNQGANALYQSVGYHQYQLDPLMGQAVFLQKKLSA